MPLCNKCVSEAEIHNKKGQIEPKRLLTGGIRPDECSRCSPSGKIDTKPMPTKTTTISTDIEHCTLGAIIDIAIDVEADRDTAVRVSETIEEAVNEVLSDL